MDRTGLLCAAAMMTGMALPASAEPVPDRAAEIGLGVLDHGVRLPWTAAPPGGFTIYEGEEERGTSDIQIVYRTPPLSGALKPRLSLRAQVNTGGRTSFASAGAEWRQHVMRGRFYAQAGIGVTVHDGYRRTPDPFAPGLTPAETARRMTLYGQRTAFGARVLFNPNLSLGWRVNDRWAVEAAFEHFSHAGVFGKQNPGIETVGVRLVHRLSR